MVSLLTVLHFEKGRTGKSIVVIIQYLSTSDPSNVRKMLQLDLPNRAKHDGILYPPALFQTKFFFQSIPFKTGSLLESIVVVSVPGSKTITAFPSLS